MATGGGGPAESPVPSPWALARRSRFLGQQYGDITKLRELAARHDREAARSQQRISRLNTKIEKLRHQATVLREKGQRVLADIPAIEQEMKQHERDIAAATARHAGGGITSDVTSLHYRMRKLQQKVVDRQHKARALELRAAVKTQKTQELKVKVDRFQEAAHLAEQEAAAYRQRADRLQLVAEQDTAAAPPAPSASPPNPGGGPGRPP
jgi:chromosome segregation ATPase